MTNSKDEKLKLLYIQCRDAYHEWLIEQGVDDSFGGIPFPGWFYDPYNIPAELLFRALYGKVSNKTKVRAEFDRKLLSMVYKNDTYDRESLTVRPQGLEYKNFTVCFQIYFRSKTAKTDLFKTQLTLSGIKFTWCSERAFWKIVDKVGVTNEYLRYRNTVFPKLNNEFDTYAVKTQVADLAVEEAVSKVARAFQGFMDCVNVVQSFNHQKRKLSHGPNDNKMAISDVGVFVAEEDSKVEILWSNIRRHSLPSESLNSLDIGKERLYKVLIRVLQDDNSVVAERLKYTVMEFASALSAEDPNLGLLGFWRCLEIATRKANQQTRKEEEILNIFKNYRPEEKYWRQQGSLIKEVRNTYVHQGVSSVKDTPDYYLNWSKQYAEAAIRILIWLYNNRAIWKNNDDIDIFFDHYSQSGRKLELAGKVLRGRSVRVA